MCQIFTVRFNDNHNYLKYFKKTTFGKWLYRALIFTYRMKSLTIERRMLQKNTFLPKHSRLVFARNLIFSA